VPFLCPFRALALPILNPASSIPFPRLTPHPELQLLTRAYRQGAFPMAQGRDDPTVSFFTANPRCVVPLEREPPWPRSLRAKVRRGHFRITSDRAFAGVIDSCAAAARKHKPEAGELPGTWINDWIRDFYIQLHACHLAHSIEAWVPERQIAAETIAEAEAPALDPHETDDLWAESPQPLVRDGGYVLVGGLYGVHLGAAFFGESMFSRPELGGSDSSKVCLVHLVTHLRRRGFELLDSQIANDHMVSLGAETMPLEAYLEKLEVAIGRGVAWEWPE